jgi:predicted nuclease of predicted toxin-antitoxin system
VTGLLLDEMYPAAAAVLLRERHGRDALHVTQAGLQATNDAQVADDARRAQRTLVTENVADFAAEADWSWCSS